MLHESSGNIEAKAISAMADSCRQRQVLAEPLWFAVMCRAIWGGNAAKELQFILGKSDRTCRAWASGDSEPPAGVLVALLFSDYGWQVLEYLFRDSIIAWWRLVLRARRITEQVDRLDLE